MKSINDLDRLNIEVKQKIQQKVSNVIDSGCYILGKNVSAFEQEFADYIGTDYCVSVANGTQALELALSSLSIGAGSEVITAANAGFYSSAAILSRNATPIYADINIDNFTIDSHSLLSCISPQTKAVIVTHLYGRIGEIDTIADICKKKRLWFIEDCAQAHGATTYGKKAGSFGDCACFSFYPTKNLGAMGDGGAITTSNSEILERLKQLRQYGWQKKYRVTMPHGTNSRLDEIQAAILRVKLPHLDAWNNARKQIAERYTNEISHSDILSVPSVSENYIAHLYVIRTKSRNDLRDYFGVHGIPTDIHYPILDYQQPILSERFAATRLPVSEMVCSQILTLPCFPEMTRDEVNQVIGAINSWRAP
jgi:dTDP-3-amino-2,3,6-trideoxy-4-keto-D-glucose/dTDP-3-amino-3,4,6-trideoxy-alpha-D-glucose/dTDP-2,6-dideoxy-D-kanosamine transaminase